MKLRTTTKHLFSTLLYFLGLAIVMLLLYWVVTMPHVKADAKGKGEFVLFITMQNGPVEETLFGGSFPDNQTCIEYAKKEYPIDNRRWIAYKCIHEDLHEYLESKKDIRVNL